MTGPRVSRCWIALEGAADAAWIAEALAMLGDAIADGSIEGRGRAVRRDGPGLLRFEVKKEG
ncbi:MAG: hypothetical protein VYD87_17225 [Pseudomonadota bacterium]|nr:hypothetical protein [Pseudomonadota bacterium]